MPSGGDQPTAFLLTIDETGAIAARSCVKANEDQDKVWLEPWSEVDVPELPLSLWQGLLSDNAGYRDFAKWRCRSCESVRCGEADAMATPCPTCSSGDADRVELTTPLTEARPSRDRRLDGPSLTSPFAQTLFGIINGRSQG